MRRQERDARRTGSGQRGRWPWIVGALGSLAIGGVAVALLTGGNGEAGEEGQSGGAGQRIDLVVGNLLPLSGDLAPLGPAAQKASGLALSQMRDAIKQAGSDHSVDIVDEDSGTNARASVEAARKLTESDGADCLTGPWGATETAPVAESVAIPGGILQISPASTTEEITSADDGGLLNRTSLPDSSQGAALATLIAADLGGTERQTVNIGARKDPYGEDLTQAFTEAWEALGGSIGASVLYDPNKLSYDLEAAEITAGDPDAFVIIDFPETFVNVGPALQRTGDWDPTKAWSADGLASSDLFGVLGQGTVKGLRGTTPGAPDVGETSAEFDKLFAAANPTEVERHTFDAQQFDAIILCYLAAVSAGSTDGQDMADALVDVTAPDGTSYTWTQLPEAIRALQNGDDIDYTGASGAIDMDENGDATAGVYDTYELTEGDLEIIGETPVTTSG